MTYLCTKFAEMEEGAGKEQRASIRWRWKKGQKRQEGGNILKDTSHGVVVTTFVCLGACLTINFSFRERRRKRRNPVGWEKLPILFGHKPQ